MELVSVVIPAYNATATLEETVRSVQGQSWTALEILIVDDGSRDGTVELAERLAADDDRIRVLRKANGGVADARNYGLAAARGEFVAPVDADDLWAPQRVARQMRRMMEIGRDCGFVYALSRRIDAASRVTGFINGLRDFEGQTFLRALSFNFVGNGSAILARRAALEGVGGYEPALHRAGVQGAEDFLIHALMARRWLVGFVDACLCGYRVTPGAMSSDPTRMRRSRLAALDYIARRHPETPDWALAAARAGSRVGLAAALAASGRHSEAAGALVAALRENTRVALDVLGRDELRRTVAPAARRLLRGGGGGTGGPTQGPPFLSVGTDDFTRPRPLALGWLAPRLQAREKAFAASAARPAAERARA